MNFKYQVKQLELYNYQVDSSVKTIEVNDRFRKEPKLPGVVICENNKLLGFIPQKNFWRYMSRPYSLELAAKRPIKYLLDFIKIEPLIVFGESLITETVQKALIRDPDYLETPILVQIQPKVYGLLDIHQLLVAFAQIHELNSIQMKEMNQELAEANQKLELVLRLDPVTGLGNQGVLEEHLHDFWSKELAAKKWLSVIRCELDFFQEYKDNCGQLAANDCLRAVADALEKVLKGPLDLATQTKEGKFTLLLPEANLIEADACADRLIEAISELAIVNDCSPINYYLTLSLGIASLKPKANVSPKTLLTMAEQALNQAKATGRNRKILANSVDDCSGDISEEMTLIVKI